MGDRPPHDERRIVTTLFVIRVLVSVALGAAVGWFVQGPLNIGEDMGEGNFLLWWGISTVGAYVVLGRLYPSRW